MVGFLRAITSRPPSSQTAAPLEATPQSEERANAVADSHHTTTEGVLETRNVGQPTMSSEDIADLLGARHDSVRRTIERLADRGTIALPPLVDVQGKGGNNRTYTTTRYIFSGEAGERDSYVVVAQLSPEFTARLVDRWRELERAVRQQADPSLKLRAPRMDVSREHRLTMKDQVMYAKMAGLTGNQLLLAANRATSMLTGIDNLGLLGLSNLPAPSDEALLSPSDIAARIGARSPQAVNDHLCDLGLQTRHRDHRSKAYYEPTPAGRARGATMVDTGKKHGDGSPVRQLRWASSIIAALEGTV